MDKKVLSFEFLSKKIIEIKRNNYKKIEHKSAREKFAFFIILC